MAEAPNVTRLVCVPSRVFACFGVRGLGEVPGHNYIVRKADLRQNPWEQNRGALSQSRVHCLLKLPLRGIACCLSMKCHHACQGHLWPDTRSACQDVIGIVSGSATMTLGAECVRVRYIKKEREREGET